MSKLEADEEKTILKWCKSNGVFFIKFTPMGEKGWPDRIAIFPGGGHVWVELKRRGKEPRALQFHRIENLRKQGAVAVWYDNAEDCIEFFKYCLGASNEMDTAPLSNEGDKYNGASSGRWSAAGPRNGKDNNDPSSV